MSQGDAGGGSGAGRAGAPRAAGSGRGGRTSGLLERFASRDAAGFDRRVVAGTALALLLLAGISVLLAWRQYDDAKQGALTDLQARAVSVGAIVEVAFAGDVSQLETVAQAPAVMGGRAALMDTYFRGVSAGSGKAFSGGISWIDRGGHLRASSDPHASVGLDLASRTYFRTVVASHKPYVSAGLIGRATRRPLIAVAVPTSDNDGRFSGVLVGSILLGTVKESAQALALGFGGLEIIDRDGNELLARLTPVPNHRLLTRMKRIGSGVLADTSGLGGHGSDAVAFASAAAPGWLVVLDRSHSALFASAAHALVLELASVGAALVVVFALLAIVLRRSRRQSQVQERRARAGSGLARALASAATPPEVAEALRHSLVEAFPGALGVVAFDGSAGVRVGGGPATGDARRAAAEVEALERIALLGRAGARSVLLEQEPGLAEIQVRSGRRLRALHALPVFGPEGRPLGIIAVLTPELGLEPGACALLEAFADQAAVALMRARLFEHEHELAVGLQRSLLPDRLPSDDAVALEGHYHAGGLGVEVGGDWYDAVRRPDGIVQLCVGDVSGRGIGAATIMGRQRNTFHAYAYEYISPAEIIRRMLRHADEDEMMTVACVSLDPCTGELVYSCAGHPPPLLLDTATGSVRRLDGASAPPIGVAEPADVIEARVRVPDRATLVLYTDGLIERRGENIDEGIDVLGRVVASAEVATPDRVITRVSELIGEPDDDVALLVVRYDAAAAPFELELPAEPVSLPSIRRRLRAWLEHRGLDDDAAADVVLAVSEACNNAIEHAYADRSGTFALSITADDERLRIVVDDNGNWRDERPNDERGRGILLMKSLMDMAEIETGERGTRVRMERLLRADRHGSTTFASSGSPS